MRIFVFEENPDLLRLLTIYLKDKGHEVYGYSGPYTCPLYQKDECTCPLDNPCAEAVIVNSRHPYREKLQILIDQDNRGCKLPKFNKAMTSASFTKKDEKKISDLGFTVIKKPFRLSAVNNWLVECQNRKLNSAH